MDQFESVDEFQPVTTMRPAVGVETSPIHPEDLFLEPESDEAVSTYQWEEAATSPFAESFATLTEAELEAQIYDDLVAELEDEDFAEALEGLVNEAAARHLNAYGTWRQSGEAPQLAESEVEQWMESILSEAERMLDDMGAEYDGRSLEWFTDEELESLYELTGSMDPLDAQELFFGALKRKFKKVVGAAKKLVKKGVKFVGKLNPITRIIAALKKAMRPLLKRILNRAIGKLPRSLRPIARNLARRLGAEAETAIEVTEAEMFDMEVAELLLGHEESLNDTVAEAEAIEEDARTDRSLEQLDEARARLARQLAELPEGQSPVDEMEQFIPAVMAAMPLIRMGLRIVGRKRVVSLLAKLMAGFMSKLVGRQAARALSRHMADQGLRLIGLEAEAEASDPTFGTEALVAAAERTIRDVALLDPEVFDDDQLLEAEIQEAFAEAAAEHVPSAFLRSDLMDGTPESERGIWVMMPRATAPIYRYKKYSRIVPLKLSRPLARSVVLTGGETLERRLDEEGVDTWPVEAEMEMYELLPGAELGHLSSFESDGAGGDPSEFEQLTEHAAAVLAGDALLGGPRRLGTKSIPSRGSGQRVFRIRLRSGRPIKRRRRFSMRLSLAGSSPALRVHLHLTERDAHRMADMVQRRQTVQVVASFRRLLDGGFQAGVASRFTAMAKRRGINLASDAAQRLSEGMAKSAIMTVSKSLPRTASELASAAKAPAAGATLSFAFPFTDRAALEAGKSGIPTLTIRPGRYRE